MMKNSLFLYSLLLLWVPFVVSAQSHSDNAMQTGHLDKSRSQAKHNSLSRKEKKAGWELLFDGKNPNLSWRALKNDQFPKEGWTTADGCLGILPGSRGGDIITREKFSDFELVLEYKLSDSANTGIKYFVSELKNVKGATVLNGPEFQLIDDFKHESVKDNQSPETSTGSLYLLYAPKDKKLNQPGEWNKVRIIAQGRNVEHWINGKKILQYQRGSDEFKSLVAKTKFQEYAGQYGEAKEGYLLIQDHKDEACFRNIKIRRLDK
ncbi:MAG TPA: DUF1080 domain-containing protein [Sphingobacteriaceae bacterium]